MFYGDDNSIELPPETLEGVDYPGTPQECKGRLGNSNPFDIAQGRRSYAVAPGAFSPVWPPFRRQDWNADLDYFSWIGRESGTGSSASGWDMVADGTRATQDWTLVLAGVGSPTVLPSQYGEIALHSMGHLVQEETSPAWVGYAEFSLRFIR